MKCIKKIVLSITLLLSQGNVCTLVQPFSPCATDIPKAHFLRVEVENNFHDVIDEFCNYILQTDMKTARKAPAEDQTSVNTNGPIASDIEKFSAITKANIVINVNGEDLKRGETISIDVDNEKPLMVSLTGDLWNLIDYLIKFNLLSSYIEKSSLSTQKREHSFLKRIKSLTTNTLNYTYCFFSGKDSADVIYEKNKVAILTAYARTYKHTCGFLGGTLTIEVPINASILKNEIINDTNNPKVDFYDIVDIVIDRLDEPEHIQYIGGIYNAVIQIA